MPVNLPANVNKLLSQGNFDNERSNSTVKLHQYKPTKVGDRNRHTWKQLQILKVILINYRVLPSLQLKLVNQKLIKRNDIILQSPASCPEIAGPENGCCRKLSSLASCLRSHRARQIFAVNIINNYAKLGINWKCN